MIYILTFIIFILIIFVIPFKIQIYYEFDDISKYRIVFSDCFELIKFEFDPLSKKKKDKNSRKTNKKLNINNRLEYLQYFIDKGKIKKIYFRVNLGFEDPSLLGISIGFAWAIINLSFGYLLKNIDINKIKEKDIQVIPFFDHNVFEIYFLCIINMKLVYIITEYIRILKRRKGGDSIVRTSNRRINEIYNE
jgi:hypothetical protein